MRAIIIDDERLARKELMGLLEKHDHIEVVGEAADGAEGIELAASLKPDVITMDINMPRVNGHEATRKIMASTPTPIVVVTTISRQELVRHGLDILLVGALDIVQKPSALTVKGFEVIQAELIAKVREVAQIKFTPPKPADEGGSLEALGNGATQPG